MVKLVEEVVISSDVLVDVLVQVGFLDKTFTDGNVSRIDSSYYRDGVNTYSITVEKEVDLKDIKGEDSKESFRTDTTGRRIYEGNKEVSITTGSGFMNTTPKGKLIMVHKGEKVLSKEDVERLLNNIDVSDKLTNNIIDTLNKWKEEYEDISSKESDKEDEESNEVDERDELTKLVDLLHYLKESVDILNAERCTSEKFAQTFIDRINTMKDIKGGF